MELGAPAILAFQIVLTALRTLHVLRANQALIYLQDQPVACWIAPRSVSVLLVIGTLLSAAIHALLVTEFRTTAASRYVEITF